MIIVVKGAQFIRVEKGPYHWAKRDQLTGIINHHYHHKGTVEWVNEKIVLIWVHIKGTC